MAMTRITMQNGSATIVVDQNIVAQYLIAYSLGNPPRVIGGHWTPDRPVRRKDIPWGKFPPEGESEYEALATEQVAQLCDLSPQAVSAVETATRLVSQAHCDWDAARIEQGRRDWSVMPQTDRDAMNDYALRTEGHTID